MNRLKKYDGNPQKVVACVMKEVLSPSDIKCGDYKSLLFHVDGLERNFNRLSNLDIEHEMSNTSTILQILRKRIGFVEVARMIEVVHSLTKHINYSALLPRFSVYSLSI